MIHRKGIPGTFAYGSSIAHSCCCTAGAAGADAVDAGLEQYDNDVYTVLEFT